MRRIISVLVMIALSVGFVFAGGASEASADGPMKLDVASVYTDGSCGDEANRLFVEKLNESGLFEATYYNNGQLGTEVDTFEAIQSGINIISFSGGSNWGDNFGSPNMGLVMTPFLFEELDDIYGITESELWAEIIAQAEANGLKLINAPVVSGTRYFMANSKFTTPEDLHGLKIRTPNSTFAIYSVEAFGGIPTSVAVSELYSSLAQKVVDGCEFPYADAFTRQLYEVVKYAANQPYVTTYDFWGMDLALWNSLSDEQRAAIESAATEASEYSFGLFQTLESEGKQKLADNGMEFIDIDVDSFRARMDNFYDLIGWDDAFVQRIEDTMAEYRASKQ